MGKKNTRGNCNEIQWEKAKTPNFTNGVSDEEELLWRFLPGPGYDLVSDNGNEQVQIFLGGILADGNPERTVDYVRRQLHGAEHMAAVSLGTGAAGADADTGILENVQTVLGGNTGDSDGQNVRCLVGSVYCDAVNRLKLFRQRIDHCLFPDAVLAERGTDFRAGGGKAENRGDSCSDTNPDKYLSLSLTDIFNILLNMMNKKLTMLFYHIIIYNASIFSINYNFFLRFLLLE